MVRVLFVGCVAFGSDGGLDGCDGLRIQEMVFAADAILIGSADIEFGFGVGERPEGVIMFHLGFFGQDFQADAFDAGRCASEIFFDQVGVEADGFEDLSAAVALQGRDAHFREHLEHALVDRLFEVF